MIVRMSELEENYTSNYLPDRNDTDNYLPIIVTDPNLDKIEVIETNVTFQQSIRTISDRREQGLLILYFKTI